MVLTSSSVYVLEVTVKYKVKGLEIVSFYLQVLKKDKNISYRWNMVILS